MGDARYGRRDNGLVAAEYAPAGDVDPRVGEHLLDVLARDGIAAYLRPSSDQHWLTRSTPRPNRPVDRLYVDRAHVATVRDHLARLAREEREAEAAGRVPAATGPTDGGMDAPTGGGPRVAGPTEPSPEEVDRAFAEIVAGFGATAAPDAVLGRPDGTEIGRPNPPSPPDLAPPPPERWRSEPEGGSLLDGLDTFGAHLPDEDPGQFVPPEPPPVPRPSLPTVLAVIGVVGGLAVFLQPGLLSFVTESLAMFVGFAMVVGGSAALVWRLRPGSDDDPDPDQGARV